jgi:hypothetical protein
MQRKANATEPCLNSDLQKVSFVPLCLGAFIQKSVTKATSALEDSTQTERQPREYRKGMVQIWLSTPKTIKVDSEEDRLCHQDIEDQSHGTGPLTL